MGVCGQRHAPAALPPGKTQYPLCRRLGGPQDRCGRMRKISHPSGFDPRTIQPVANRYTDWAIAALSDWTYRLTKCANMLRSNVEFSCSWTAGRSGLEWWDRARIGDQETTLRREDLPPFSIQERKRKSELLFYPEEGGCGLSRNVSIHLPNYVTEYKNLHLISFPYHVIGAELQIVAHTHTHTHTPHTHSKTHTHTQNNTGNVRIK